MTQPELITFDKLSLGLAPLIVDGLYKAIVEINRRGMTVLLIEQNVCLNIEIADRGYIIERGRIVISGVSETFKWDEHVRGSISAFDWNTTL
jgi:branched-chain amino acid transport system ATP-binding protein